MIAHQPLCFRHVLFYVLLCFPIFIFPFSSAASSFPHTPAVYWATIAWGHIESNLATNQELRLVCVFVCLCVSVPVCACFLLLTLSINRLIVHQDVIDSEENREMKKRNEKQKMVEIKFSFLL